MIFYLYIDSIILIFLLILVFLFVCSKEREIISNITSHYYYNTKLRIIRNNYIINNYDLLYKSYC